MSDLIQRIFHNGISIVCVLILCSATTCLNSHSENLTKVGQYNLSMPEPSGLALDPDGAHLWIVSDRKGQIYKVDLMGNTIAKVDIKARDYEGVGINAEGNLLYVLDETKNRITCYDLSGDKTCELDLPIKSSNKSGAEGLDVDWETGNFIVVNEKNPRLIIEMTPEGKEVKRLDVTPLNDLSAVCINPKNKDIWLLSDEDQKLLHVDRENKILDVYLMDIIQMEGLGIDFEKKRIYIVSDSEEELHIFKYN